MDPMQRWLLEAAYRAFENGEAQCRSIYQWDVVLTWLN
jgi:acyl transferase domain-containing protein